jgi:hypothetical protein
VAGEQPRSWLWRSQRAIRSASEPGAGSARGSLAGGMPPFLALHCFMRAALSMPVVCLSMAGGYTGRAGRRKVDHG